MWIKPIDDDYECVSTHPGDLMVAANENTGSINQIKEAFDLRSERKMYYFLGHDTCKKQNLMGTLH